ncbi:hypothetical protein FQA39_LY14579 [Lamprigera yunnana]|nr:hypothetical protein FQA39_LY14579 [Lamprigera yunnana]
MKYIVAVLACVAFAYASPTRVVNGTDADIKDYPYIVSLQDFNSHSCGGSIIDAKHILTAAHCVYGSTTSYMTIQYGLTNLDSSEGQSISVDNISIHPNFYYSDPFPYDVAVLTLKDSIRFSDVAQPVNLPAQDEAAPVNEPSVLVGWGARETWGGTSSTLQKVQLKIYSHEDCKAAHSSVIYEHNLCSGVVEGWKGQCSGDSGGPLTAGGKQHGVVSWSRKPCAIVGYPGVYARVSSYIDWIHEKVAESS